ncbi:hypothetical protein CR513_10276, partial [Mucuna pruriens]
MKNTGGDSNKAESVSASCWLSRLRLYIPGSFLDGTRFQVSFQSMALCCGCKKLSHIEENSPPRDDPKFEAWDNEDSLIMT